MPTRKPLVGVSCCYRTEGIEPVHGVIDRYVNAAAKSLDADIVLVPALPDNGGLADSLDGLILTGSPSNIPPDISGACGGEGPFDPRRDATNFGMARQMIAAGKPIFGICRGLQELNVVYGGSLKVCNAVSHHAPHGVQLEEMFGHSHAITLDPAGILHDLYGTDEITVNSVHFQAVDRLGSDLRVEATSADGLIEAFSAEDGRVLAVQWHPEWDSPANSRSRLLYDHFQKMLERAVEGAR